MTSDRSLLVGITAGLALSAWNVAAMLWPVPYGVWDVGRGVLFVAFLLMVTAVAMSTARKRGSVWRGFGAGAVACLAAAACTLTIYAIVTKFFAHRIVQLPEYVRDYTHHGYTSPAAYLAANYSALLGLQVFAWAISAAGIIAVAGLAAWCLGRFRVPI